MQTAGRPRMIRAAFAAVFAVYFIVIIVYCFFNTQFNIASAVLLAVILGMIGIGYGAGYRALNRIVGLRLIDIPLRLSCIEIVGIAFGTIILGLFVIAFMFPQAQVSFVQMCVGIVEVITLAFFVYGLFTLAFTLIGRALLHRLRMHTDSSFERSLLAIAFGMGVAVLYFFGVSVMHVLNLWTVALFFLFTIIVCSREIPILFRDTAARSFSIHLRMNPTSVETQKILFYLLLAAIGIIAFASVGGYHPVGGDDMRTYLTVPLTYGKEGGITPFVYDRFNNGSLAFAYLYAPLLLVAPRVINYISIYFFILVLAAVWLNARQWFNERTALLAVFFVLTMPWTLWFLVVIKVDFMIAFFGLVAVGALLKGKQRGQGTWFAVCGSLVGLMGAIKYTALLVVPAVCIIALAPHVSTHAPLRKRVVDTSIIIGSALAVMLPWLLYNMIIWHNPLYPYSLASQLFHSDIISPFVTSLTSLFFSPLWSQHQVLSSLNPWWLNLWYLLSNTTLYPLNRIGPLFLGTLPLMMVQSSDSGSRTTPLLVLIFVTIGVWLFIAPSQVWYILYIFPIWCIVIAHMVTSAPIPSYIRIGIVVCLTIVSFINLDTSRVSKVKYYSNRFSIDSFRSDAGYEISLGAYLNTVIKKENPRYVVFPMGSFHNVMIDDSFKHVYGDNYLFEKWISLVGETKSDADLLHALRSMGVTHLYQIYGNTWPVSERCQQFMDSRHCTVYDYVMYRFNTFVKSLTLLQRTDRWAVYQL